MKRHLFQSLNIYIRSLLVVTSRLFMCYIQLNLLKGFFTFLLLFVKLGILVLCTNMNVRSYGQNFPLIKCVFQLSNKILYNLLATTFWRVFIRYQLHACVLLCFNNDITGLGSGAITLNCGRCHHVLVEI